MSFVAILQANATSIRLGRMRSKLFPTPSTTLLLIALLAGFGHFDGR